MPYPENLATARGRRGRGPPATAPSRRRSRCVDGRVRVGLDDAALERLAAGRPATWRKASRRDLPALARPRGASAGTTVAATMTWRTAAGIGVFATGGIGGVHRGAERTPGRLRRPRRARRDAGDRGLRRREVDPRPAADAGGAGDPGRAGARLGTDEFPAFFARDSGLPVPHRVDSAAELAGVVARAPRARPARRASSSRTRSRRPTPPGRARSRARIDEALADAERAGVTGKDVTPFLLGRIIELTGGAAWPRTSPWSGTTPGSRRPPRSRWRRSSRSRRPGPGWPRTPPARPG